MSRLRPQKLGDQLNSVGDFIAAQRRAAELTLRQLAEQTGISNPYLSQIERGLRKPSAEVLQQLAKALRVSAESLYVRAGILDPDDHPSTTVETAVLSDLTLTERQKQVLLDIYTSFVREHSRAKEHSDAAEHQRFDAEQGVAPSPDPDDQTPTSATTTGPASAGPTPAH